MLRTPRAYFASTPHRAKFEAIATAPEFEAATLAALLEFQADLPMDTTPNQAADAHNMMVGARRFLSILCTIHQPVTNQKPAKLPELDWSAGV